MKRREFLEVAGDPAPAWVVPGSLLAGETFAATPSPGPDGANDKNLGSGEQKAAPTLSFFLDGEWSIATDPQNVGRDQNWFQGPRPDAKNRGCLRSSRKPIPLITAWSGIGAAFKLNRTPMRVAGTCSVLMRSITRPRCG